MILKHRVIYRMMFTTLIYAQSFVFSNIDMYLDTYPIFVNTRVKNVDAIFIISNNHSLTRVNALKQKLSESGIESSYFEKYHSRFIPEKLLSQYCSEFISPELLAQILNHNTIYKCSLIKEKSVIGIIEANATLIASKIDIEKSIEKLQYYDPNWDILYLNSDYCIKSDKIEYATPHYGPLSSKTRKVRINDCLSKVYSRYGCSAYVISKNGLQKALKYFTKVQSHIPLDQSFAKIPNFRAYSTNKDIFVDKVKKSHPSESKNKAHQTEIVYIKRNHFPLGKIFWINPIELLTTSRLDIVVKYLYAKSQIEKKMTSLSKKYYLEHIKGWNNFYEGAPLKVGPEAFLNSFNQLITSMSKHGFSPSAEPVPISSSGEIINGSHRVGVCLALNIPVKVKVVKVEPQYSKKPTFINYMKGSHNLSNEAINFFINGYISLKQDSIYSLKFPNTTHESIIKNVVSRYVDIINNEETTYLVESKTLNNIKMLERDWSSKYPGTVIVEHL